MRVLLLALALLAGCASDSGDDQTTTSTTSTTSPTTATNATSSTTPTTSSTSSTSSSTTTTTTTTSTTTTGGPAYGVIAQQEYSGSAPAPAPGEEAIVIDHTFEIPAGGDHFMIWYNTTYTGLFHALLVINDPDGNEKLSSIDECETPEPGVMAEDMCFMELQEPLMPGAWNLHLVWQAGEVTEEYHLDAVALGLL